MTPVFGQRFHLRGHVGVWVFMGHDVSDDVLPYLMRPLGDTGNDLADWTSPERMSPCAEPLAPRLDGCLPTGTMVLVGEEEELGVILDVDETDSRLPYWVGFPENDPHEDNPARWCEPCELTAVHLVARVLGRQVCV